MSETTTTELRRVLCLSDLPEEHLQWMLERGEVTEFKDGDLIYKTNDPIDELILVIEGKSHFYMDVNGKLVYYFTFENNQQTGGAGGLLPYSRMKGSPGYNYAVGHVKMLRLHKKYFR